MHYLTSRAAMKAHQRLSGLPGRVHTPLANGDDPEDKEFFSVHTGGRRKDGNDLLIKRVRETFEANGNAMTIMDVAEAIQEPYNGIQVSVYKLWKSGVLRRLKQGRGKQGPGLWVFVQNT